MAYLRSKGLGIRGPVEKAEEEKFVTLDQFKAILDSISHDTSNPNQARDHCAIYLGFYLACRIGECAILERRHFRMIDHSQVFVPTLKNTVRIEVRCSNPHCLWQYRAGSFRIGGTLKCPKCGQENPVVCKNPATIKKGPVEISPPAIEQEVIDYVKFYMKNYMRGDQRWLFEPSGSQGEHISPRTLWNVFSTYAAKAGLPPTYSWHSLRHGRGVSIYENPKYGGNLKLIQRMLRHRNQATTEIYMHFSPQRVGSIREALDDVSLGIKPVGVNDGKAKVSKAKPAGNDQQADQRANQRGQQPTASSDGAGKPKRRRRRR